MSKIKYLFLCMGICFYALTSPVYAVDRAYQTKLTLPERQDISLHVFLPANTPKGVLIALHGCGGLLSTNTKTGDKLSARHAGMAKFANDLDWIAIFPDSFTHRGRREICTQKFSERTIKQGHRKMDALATAHWVKAQNWLGDRPSITTPSPLNSVLLGWSNGGTTVLQTIETPKTETSVDSAYRVDKLIDQAVAFYPGCSRQLARDYQTRVPLTLFIGGKDDWTPPQPCIALGKSIGAQLFVYPEAHHGFDSPTGQVRLRRDIPNGVIPGEGVHVGPHPASRADAYDKLKKILEQLSYSIP